MLLTYFSSTHLQGSKVYFSLLNWYYRTIFARFSCLWLYSANRAYLKKLSLSGIATITYIALRSEITFGKVHVFDRQTAKTIFTSTSFSSFVTRRISHLAYSDQMVLLPFLLGLFSKCHLCRFGMIPSKQDI